MTAALVSVAAAALALWFAWRGFSRGAATMLRAWLPALAAIIVLFAMVRIAWAWPQYLFCECALGLTAAAAVFLIVAFALRSRARRRSKPASRAAGWLWWADRVGGMFFGILYAAVVCLGLAFIGSAVSFAVCFRAGSPDAEAADPRWARLLRQGSAQVADLANFGVLRHVPGLREESREVVAVITILNTPSRRLGRLAEKRGFVALLNAPEVQDAIGDDQYRGLIENLGRGDLGALRKLAASPTTKRLFESPQVRTVAKNLRPSQLAAELGQLPDEPDE